MHFWNVNNVLQVKTYFNFHFILLSEIVDIYRFMSVNDNIGRAAMTHIFNYSI